MSDGYNSFPNSCMGMMVSTTKKLCFFQPRFFPDGGIYLVLLTSIFVYDPGVT